MRLTQTKLLYYSLFLGLIPALMVYGIKLEPMPASICCGRECRDEGMLVGLQDYIDGKSGGDILIVLHQMGNHGPAYYKQNNPLFSGSPIFPWALAGSGRK